MHILHVRLTFAVLGYRLASRYLLHIRLTFAIIGYRPTSIHSIHTWHDTDWPPYIYYMHAWRAHPLREEHALARHAVDGRAAAVVVEKRAAPRAVRRDLHVHSRPLSLLACMRVRVRMRVRVHVLGACAWCMAPGAWCMVHVRVRVHAQPSAANAWGRCVSTAATTESKKTFSCSPFQPPPWKAGRPPALSAPERASWFQMVAPMRAPKACVVATFTGGLYWACVVETTGKCSPPCSLSLPLLPRAMMWLPEGVGERGRQL